MRIFRELKASDVVEDQKVWVEMISGALIPVKVAEVLMQGERFVGDDACRYDLKGTLVELAEDEPVWGPSMLGPQIFTGNPVRDSEAEFYKLIERGINKLEDCRTSLIDIETIGEKILEAIG